MWHICSWMIGFYAGFLRRTARLRLRKTACCTRRYQSRKSPLIFRISSTETRCRWRRCFTTTAWTTTLAAARVIKEIFLIFHCWISNTRKRYSTRAPSMRMMPHCSNHTNSPLLDFNKSNQCSFPVTLLHLCIWAFFGHVKYVTTLLYLFIVSLHILETLNLNRIHAIDSTICEDRAWWNCYLKRSVRFCIVTLIANWRHRINLRDFTNVSKLNHPFKLFMVFTIHRSIAICKVCEREIWISWISVITLDRNGKAYRILS